MSRFKRYFISCALLAVSFSLIYFGSQEIQTTFALKSEIRNNLKESAKLDDEKKELETTKKNLSNPDYVEYIARGKYLVSREGEQVFKFPSIDLQEEE
ncbi:septum formation initiator family protein [Dubosiella muris]|uniref:Septum formation initiator family protein n=2 Tax=Dubosiella TaxID=1937008 RepID=A0AC61R654_9FIRM|nr:septum formation initiator family protein [Dubosiella muris]TGY65514.1 septum formation initiator family protein [Dubosiella muris]